MKFPLMRSPALATIYLDDEALGLMGDPRPSVAKILAAAGHSGEDAVVLRGRSRGDTRGTPLAMDDAVDRTAEPATPIYLMRIPATPPATDSHETVRAALARRKATPGWAPWPASGPEPAAGASRATPRRQAKPTSPPGSARRSAGHAAKAR